MPVSNTTGTYLADLFNPQVVGDLVNAKLSSAIKFTPLATVDATLAGTPGDTITLPSFAYIGDASDTPEGTDCVIKKLTTSATSVKVKKIAIGVEVTDEAALSGYGDPIGRAVDQITRSIASKLDTDMLTALSTNAINVYDAATALTADDIADALVKFGEDIDGPKVLLTDAKTYATLRKGDWIPASEVAADVVMSGTVGMVQGCQVVVSDRIKPAAGFLDSYIVKPGALALFLKREILVETDRDTIAFSTVITASKHYASYLFDPSKAIKITQPST